MSICEQSADEFFLSLNGFDEIAIAKAFEGDIAELRDKPFMFLRVLAFVHQRRKGSNDRDARVAVLTMTIDELGDYFPDAKGDLAEDLDSGEPETDAGKGPLPSD